MPASIVRPTLIYAVAVTLAVIALAACGESDPNQESTPTRATGPVATPTAQPTPTGAPTPDAPTSAGIGLDPATAAATLVQLVDPLDEPEYYCIDVPGFGARLNLAAALMAHTCKPGAADEMFAVNRPAAGNLSMPAYDLCMQADGTEAAAELHLEECADSELQRFTYAPEGALTLSGTDLCIALAPDAGRPTGGPSHLRRDLLLQPCDTVESALSRWMFPGPSPE